MSKKLLSVVLALALVFSCFAVSAFAIGGLGYESEEDAATYTQTWALGEPVNNGNGTYSVDVKLTANYGVGTMQFVVNKTINAGSLTLTGVAVGKDIPAVWLATAPFKDATNMVMIVPSPAIDAVPALDCTTEKVVATLTYTASADVSASLSIDVDPKTQENPGGTLFAARMSDGNVVTGTSIVGQTVNPTNTVTIGSAASTPPTLVAIDGTLGVVDTSRTEMDVDDIDGDGDTMVIDGYLLGFDPDNNGAIDELFAVEGDGEMQIVATEAGSEAGTGTMVNVVDNDGNVVETYVVIVFGDVNGDGFADTTDASNIEQHDGWVLGDLGRLYSYQDFAGDVNIDGACDTTDASNIEQHDGWVLGDLGRIDVAGNLAALGF